MGDLLRDFPIHRQAAIIRTFLCRPDFDRSGISGIGRYRSAGDIRAIVAAERTVSCPARRFTGDNVAAAVLFKDAARQRLYTRLVEHYGPLCIACGKNYGRVIDHDHILRLVRGLVCGECNHKIEHCIHVDAGACAVASYMNAPPAFDLRLNYPASHRQRALDDVRRAILGFDIFDRDAWPSPIPADWSWQVPSDEILVEVEIDWWRRHPNASEFRRSYRLRDAL